MPSSASALLSTLEPNVSQGSINPPLADGVLGPRHTKGSSSRVECSEHISPRLKRGVSKAIEPQESKKRAVSPSPQLDSEFEVDADEEFLADDDSKKEIKTSSRLKTHVSETQRSLSTSGCRRTK